MSKYKHTPGPWSNDRDHKQPNHRCITGRRDFVIATCPDGGDRRENNANARLIAAAPDMLEALRLHQAWIDSERAGPNYGKQCRDTHPEGERIWREWWDGQLSLCDKAVKATSAAITKATRAEKLK